MKKYQITDDHKIELKKIKDFWTQNALSTKSITEDERRKFRTAMRGLYKNAGLPYPGDNKIIFVKSPLAAQVAFARTLELINITQTAGQTNVAIGQAVEQTEQAVRQAAWQAETAANQAVRQAVLAVEQAADQAETAANQAVRQAAWQAETAIEQAARQAEQAARQAIDQAVGQADDDVAAEKNWLNFDPKILLSVLKTKFGLYSFSFSQRLKNSGNFWPWQCVFGDFFKNVAKIPSQWEKFDPLANAAKYGSVRYMHSKFTIVSDRPEILRIDEQGRPHCIDGPSHRWRDGLEFYHLWGVQTPKKYVLTPPEKINPIEILLEKNAQVRMAVIKKCGFGHFLKELKNKEISKAKDCKLLEFDFGQGLIVRGLQVQWKTKQGENHETVIPVPSTKEQFGKTGFVPKNIDDAEMVRRWTMNVKNDAEFVKET